MFKRVCKFDNRPRQNDKNTKKNVNKQNAAVNAECREREKTVLNNTETGHVTL